MDPTVALAHIREQLDLAERAPSLAHANVHRERACEAMRGLDAFISSGGFLPSQWTEAQRRALENTRRTRLDLPPSPEDEARTELERRAVNRTRTRCWANTLAGTQSPVPCPPEVR